MTNLSLPPELKEKIRGKKISEWSDQVEREFFDWLVTSHPMRVWLRVAASRLGLGSSPDNAMDAVQGWVMSLKVRPLKLRRRVFILVPDELIGLLVKDLRRRCGNAQRKDQRRSRLAPETPIDGNDANEVDIVRGPSSDPEAEFLDAAKKEALWSAIEVCLKNQVKADVKLQMLVLRYADGRSHKEIVMKLGLTTESSPMVENTCRKTIFDLIRKLRRCQDMLRFRDEWEQIK